MDGFILEFNNFNLAADCPAVDPWPCAEQWFPADCERYYNVPEECKIMCGTCPGK